MTRQRRVRKARVNGRHNIIDSRGGPTDRTKEFQFSAGRVEDCRPRAPPRTDGFRCMQSSEGAAPNCGGRSARRSLSFLPVQVGQCWTAFDEIRAEIEGHFVEPKEWNVVRQLNEARAWTWRVSYRTGLTTALSTPQLLHHPHQLIRPTARRRQRSLAPSFLPPPLFLFFSLLFWWSPLRLSEEVGRRFQHLSSPGALGRFLLFELFSVSL